MERHTVLLQFGEVALLQTIATAVHQQDVVAGHFETASGRPVVALACQPLNGVERLGDMHLQHFFVALIVGDTHDLVPQLGFGAVRHAFEQCAQFVVSGVFYQRADVFEAVEHETHVAGQRTVAAAIALGGFFDDADARIFFQCGVRGGAGRVAGADDQHVVVDGLI